jgi:hypothetical protein
LRLLARYSFRHARRHACFFVLILQLYQNNPIFQFPSNNPISTLKQPFSHCRSLYALAFDVSTKA